MEWSHGKDRMASVLERLLEPKKEKKTFSQKLKSCFCCFTNKDKHIKNDKDSIDTDETYDRTVHFKDTLSFIE